MRYLRSSLLAGLVFCVFAPAVVHFLVPDEIVREFAKVFERIEGGEPRSADAPTNWLHVAMVLALRLGFGFLTMGLYAYWRSGEPRLRAAYKAGVAVFVLTCVPLLAWFHFGHGLPAPMAMLGFSIGMVETMLAAMVGAWAAGAE